MESISVGIVSEHFKDIYDNAYEAIVRMENVTRSIAFEYTHINNRERVWLKRRIETPYKATLNDNQNDYLKSHMSKVLKSICIKTL